MADPIALPALQGSYWWDIARGYCSYVFLGNLIHSSKWLPIVPRNVDAKPANRSLHSPILRSFLDDENWCKMIKMIQVYWSSHFCWVFSMSSVSVPQIRRFQTLHPLGVNLPCGSQNVCSEAEVGKPQNQRGLYLFQKRKGTHQNQKRT